MRLGPPGRGPLHLQRVPLSGDVPSDLYVSKLHPHVQHSWNTMHHLHAPRRGLPMQHQEHLRARSTSCARRSPGGSSSSASTTTRPPNRPLSPTATAHHPARRKRLNSRPGGGGSASPSPSGQGEAGGTAS